MAEDARDAKRDQMVVAAAGLIAERGFADTRIADVAKRVGASPGLVIYYFGTKDNLLTEALRWSERTFYQAVDDMLRTTPALVDRLDTLVAWTLQGEGEDRPDDWGLWFDLWAQAFRHPEVKKDRVELDQQWRDLVTGIVTDAVDAGEIEKLDVGTFVVMWCALLDGLVVQVALGDPVVDGALAQRIALDVAHRELGLAAAGRRRRRAGSAKR